MKTLEELPIKIDREKIAAFCRERGIRKMSLFGSVVRDDFDPARSDVDVLVDFAPGALDGVGLSYFGWGDELAGIVGRKVDFCSKLHPRIEPRVRREALTVYEHA
jgi:predicted nucleotidyltransferase